MVTTDFSNSTKLLFIFLFCKRMKIVCHLIVQKMRLYGLQIRLMRNHRSISIMYYYERHVTLNVSLIRIKHANSIQRRSAFPRRNQIRNSTNIIVNGFVSKMLLIYAIHILHYVAVKIDKVVSYPIW